jgi:hypothetical protein
MAFTAGPAFFMNSMNSMGNNYFSDSDSDSDSSYSSPHRLSPAEQKKHDEQARARAEREKALRLEESENRFACITACEQFENVLHLYSSHELQKKINESSFISEMKTHRLAGMGHGICLAILNSPRLNDLEKKNSVIQLINMLHEYYYVLLESPILQIIHANPIWAEEIAKVYFNTLGGPGLIPYGHDNMIWQALLNANPDNGMKLLAKFINDIQNNKAFATYTLDGKNYNTANVSSYYTVKLIDFFRFWLETFNNSAEVIRTYDSAKNLFSVFKDLDKLLTNILQSRFLVLSQKEQAEQHSHKANIQDAEIILPVFHEEEEKPISAKEIDSFLKRNQKLQLCCAANSNAHDIYAHIRQQRNVQEALSTAAAKITSQAEMIVEKSRRNM